MVCPRRTNLPSLKRRLIWDRADLCPRKGFKEYAATQVIQCGQSDDSVHAEPSSGGREPPREVADEPSG